MLQLLPLEGLGQSGIGLPTGVQTTTTPTLTLTPTTLRLLLDEEQPAYHNEAGFVPPVVQTNAASTYINMVDSKAWQGGSVTTMTTAAAAPASSVASGVGVVTTVASIGSQPPPPPASVSPPLDSPPTPAKRNVGGRRPNKAKGVSVLAYTSVRSSV